MKKKYLILLLCLFSLGFILLCLVLPSEWIALPESLDSVGRFFYRIAFFVVLPFRTIVIIFIQPAQSHHFSTWHWIVVCFGSPFFYWVLWQLMLYRRRWYAREIEPATDSEPNVTGRRQFLMKTAVGGIALTAGGVGAWGVLIEPQQLRTRRYEVPIQDLPDSLNGLRLVHISDTHYGPYVSIQYLKKVYARANALEPDLVVLTGDYVHRTPRSIEPGIGAMGDLRARLGVVAVLGNHDHWEGAEACLQAFGKTDIALVDNRRLFLDRQGLSEQSRSGESICVAGLGDLWEEGIDPERALEGVSPTMPRLLLSHNPDTAEMITPPRRMDLMLCGHTHGGQVRLPLIGAPIIPIDHADRYAGGLCKGPNGPVLVSRGVGVAFLPVRLGVPPEIGLITLRRA